MRAICKSILKFERVKLVNQNNDKVPPETSSRDFSFLYAKKPKSRLFVFPGASSEVDPNEIRLFETGAKEG